MSGAKTRNTILEKLGESPEGIMYFEKLRDSLGMSSSELDYYIMDLKNDGLVNVTSASPGDRQIEADYLPWFIILTELGLTCICPETGDSAN